MKNKKKLLVVDINSLPSEYKESGDMESTRKKLQKIYKCKVFLVDTSKQNTQGNQVFNTVYFVK